MWESIKRAAGAALIMVLHLTIAVIPSACLKASELVWRWMFSQEEPLVIGLFPFRWILEAGEAGITPVFIVFGVLEAIRVMREPNKD